MIKLYDKCLRCGRTLKSDTSQILGYGPSCYKKVLKENQPKSKPLFVLPNCKEMLRNVKKI